MADFAEALEKLTDVLAPSGLMLPFAGKTIPDGWLLCNGAAVSRTTYANLFSAIGTTWGAGDGSTTFNLPNCDSRFMEGTTDASKVGTYLEAGLPNISGEVDSRCYHDGTRYMFLSGSRAMYVKIITDGSRSCVASGTEGNANAFGIDASRQNALFGKAATIQPKSAYTLMIIKV